MISKIIVKLLILELLQKLITSKNPDISLSLSSIISLDDSITSLLALSLISFSFSSDKLIS